MTAPPPRLVLVSVEPTEAMLESAHAATWVGSRTSRTIYRAMLSSAPEVPSEEMVERASRAHSPELWARIDKYKDDDDWNGGTSLNARNMCMKNMRAALAALLAGPR